MVSLFLKPRNAILGFARYDDFFQKLTPLDLSKFNCWLFHEKLRRLGEDLVICHTLGLFIVFWGNLKSQFYKKNPQSILYLKGDAISIISKTRS